MKEPCLYCDEPTHDTGDKKHVLCGSCVQKFLQMDKDQLIELRKIYTKKQMEGRLMAVNMFLSK